MNHYREKAALRGEPSYVWRVGQERRLQMIREAAGARIHGRVLDNGCGVGAYLLRLAQETTSAYGLEFDMERALEAARDLKTIVRGAGEHLPYPSDTFDLVLSHEVLEHVQDDRAALEEIVRVLRKPGADSSEIGGRLILFVPNRGYPFETHGIYWRGRYHFGNVPLINYMPRNFRDRFAPHVRAYTRKDLGRLLDGLPIRVVKRTTLFGAYDNIIARWPTFGRALRTVLHFLERTPLRAFGLSHFWVIEKI
jgi:SAM-dependent methyltransferase